MLSSLLQFDKASSHPALATASIELSWRQLRDQVERERQSLADLVGARVGLCLTSNVSSLVRLLALTALDCHVYLLADDTKLDVLAQWADDFRWTHFMFPQEQGIGCQATKNAAGDTDSAAVTILTSGTTGKPKAVEHTWQSLTRPVRIDPNPRNPRWLLTFRPHLYAGLQVILQCLLNRGALVLPESGSSPQQVADLALAKQVEFVSATPSYWRSILTLADHKTLGKIPLRQITLGGEAVDQPILDALRRLYPTTRLVHIYATTELGRCFSVTDGKAGFPARFLDGESADGVKMRVEDGELIASSSNAMRRYDGSTELGSREFRTGDLVSLRDDRVLFVGRKTEMINVGGNKVYPFEIEQIIRSVPGVADARVRGEASSIVGQLVKCEVVVAEGFASEEVERAIRAKSLAELAPFQRPRLISMVSEIPRTAAGKVQR